MQQIILRKICETVRLSEQFDIQNGWKSFNTRQKKVYNIITRLELHFTFYKNLLPNIFKIHVLFLQILQCTVSG